MSLFPLQPATQADIYIQGNIKIDPSVAIAPGVILQAAPECSISIAAGVCIGMGTIINATQGTVEIGAGVILGAGVLILGNAKIGANSCIGAATTIYNAIVEPMQFIRAGTILGDTSRKIKEVSPWDESQSEPDSPPIQEETVGKEAQNGSQPKEEEKEISPSPPPEAENGIEAHPAKNAGSTIYGRSHVNQMLFSLFPNRRPTEES